ncbi:MAG: methylenetetrahydrofolate reductase C-terminal domain-containing protein [Halofilum sp. (in: g-proteobacteria)]
MYAVRRWSVRHARGLETFYNGFERVLLWLEPVIRRLGYERLEKPVAWFEEKVKGFLFDCQMCGQCALSRTGMSCPMNCPKQLRNGPCGGVRANGNCEVKPDMKCVWVEAWNGSRRMRHGSQIHNVEVAVDRQLEGSSSWLRVVRIKTEEKRRERADGEQAA